MFELIQDLILNNEGDTSIQKFYDYVRSIQEPYFLTLTEYRRIISLMSREYRGSCFIRILGEEMLDERKIIMNEEMFCDFIKQFSESNHKKPNMSLDYNMNMFNLIMFYSSKYELDPSMLCDMAIPKYTEYVNEIYSNLTYPLIFPA